MTIPCLNQEQLQRLLNGRIAVAEQAEWSSHLEACESCQRSLESLVASNETWSLAAQRLADANAGYDPALDAVIGRAKQLHREDDAPESAPLSLDFLEASNNPDVLGRLGHYDILEVIGRGGMGIVLKAFDTSLRRIVAIKVMAPHLAANGSARSRFVREAIATAAVVHEHVLAIHSVAETSQTPYLVMQFIEGKTLQDRLDSSGCLDVREILRIGTQTAAGLAAAHAQGLVHRDIKPANILLENGVERVKLMDFGLARAVDDASVTQSGVIKGTPQYMSPEQARGDTVDHRSDLFSLGSVLYAMCVGHTPFRAATTMGVLKRICDEAPRPIQETNPEIPYWLSEIVDKLHAKNPADRYQSASEVAAVLADRLATLQLPYQVSSAEVTGKAIRKPTPDTASIRPVPPMFLVLFWSSWALLTSLPLLLWLGPQYSFIGPQPVRSPLLLLMGIGLNALVAMIVIQAIKNGSWSATSLGPHPLLAASLAIGLPIAALYVWLDNPASVVESAVSPRAVNGPLGPPAANPKDSSGSEALIKELRTLVEQSEQSLNRSRALFEAGRSTANDMFAQQKNLLDAKIRLASAENQPEKVIELLEELVKAHEDLLQTVETRHKHGVVSDSELSRARQELTEARIRRATAKQAGKD